MTKDDEERPVFRRGIAEQNWRAPSDYVPPVPKEPFSWRGALPKTDTPPQTPEERAGTWASRVRLGIGVLVAASLTLLALQGSVKGFKADGVSMEPALHNGEHIVVNRLAYAQKDFGLLDWAPFIDPPSRSPPSSSRACGSSSWSSRW
jgi:hypothetical protein